MSDLWTFLTSNGHSQTGKNWVMLLHALSVFLRRKRNYVLIDYLVSAEIIHVHAHCGSITSVCDNNRFDHCYNVVVVRYSPCFTRLILFYKYILYSKSTNGHAISNRWFSSVIKRVINRMYDINSFIHKA